MIIVLQAALFVTGLCIVLWSMNSAVRTFVMPRSASERIPRLVFRSLRRVFNIIMRFMPRYEQRDQLMAMFAPLASVLLVPVFLIVETFGFALMFWGTGRPGLPDSIATSGSSLFTLGFVTVDSPIHYVLAFAAAATGMIMPALLISYLPTIYGTFQRRESLVSQMEVAAGSPPSAVILLTRTRLLKNLAVLGEVWRNWNTWFIEIEESHTSLTAAVYFRSQQPNRSWITTAGAVLDAAALARSTIDIPLDIRADLMIRSGYLALKYIAQVYGRTYHPNPHFPEQPISVSQDEFNSAYDTLVKADVPVLPDREKCWLDFAGWRVNYDAQLLDLCALVMAPEAPWLADRCEGRIAISP